MQTVRSMLDQKGRQVYSVAVNAPIREAIAELSRRQIGAVLVTQDGRPAGILSERDVVRRLSAGDLGISLEQPVSDLMSQPVITVTSAHTVEECMALMTARRIRHLPVVEQGETVGMISIGDVVKAFIQDREFLISHMERYISGDVKPPA